MLLSSSKEKWLLSCKGIAAKYSYNFEYRLDDFWNYNTPKDAHDFD